MVEFYANNANDPGDYLIGEKININGNGTPLRYMYNPSLDGSSHGCWSTTTNEHRRALLLRRGATTSSSTSPRAPAPPRTAPRRSAAPPRRSTGIGRAKAEKIWYRALDVYFTSNTTYVNTANPAQHRPGVHAAGRRRPVRQLLHRVQGGPDGVDRGQRGRQRRRLRIGSAFRRVLEAG